jgi:hypothetical protein
MFEKRIVMKEYVVAPALISPEGIICVLFKKYNTLKFYRSDLHRIFFCIHRNGEFDDILKKWRYSGSAVNPHSQVLDEALFNLLYCGAIGFKGMDLNEYYCADGFERTYEICTENVSDEVIKKVEKLCEIVYNTLKNS